MNDKRPLSRGLRNRNPGNIRRSGVRYKGECARSGDAEFRQFESMEWGYRAMFVLLHTYSRKHGCRTVRDMISRYAPPSENDTEAYIRRVEAVSRIGAREVIDTLDGNTMTAVVAAMSEVENGVKAVPAEVRQGWLLFAEDFGGGNGRHVRGN